MSDIAIRVTGVHCWDMNWIGIIAGLAASLTAGSTTLAWSPQPDPVVGEQHKIIVSYETSRQDSDGSSGSSRGSNTTLERVIAVSDLGIELEFDLPQDATAEDRARVWQYPARVLQPSGGTMRLLNGPELDARLDRWLATAEWTREVCGHWIFTWNAFLIECDPESVVAEIEAFDLRSVDVREGATYRHPGTLGSGTLSKATEGPDGATFSVSLDVDADAVRRSRAEADVAVGEMIQRPVTLETALRERSTETVTGTVEITFAVDAAGRPMRRTVVTTLETVGSDGVSETDRRTVTVERRVASGPTNLP